MEPKTGGSMNKDTTTSSSEDIKQREYGQVFSKFADMTSMSGVGYIKNTKVVFAKVVWSILLVLALGAMSVHLWSSLSQFYSYPKTAKINLGFANLNFPEITICNVNPVTKRRLDSYESETVETLKKLVEALNPKTLAPEQFNDSMSYDDIAELYAGDGYDYYEDFWNSYDYSSFYDSYSNYDFYDYNNYEYNYDYNYGYDYDYGNGNDYGADNGNDYGANNGNDYGAGNGNDYGANNGNDYGADGGTDNGADGGTDNGADGGNDYGADGGTDNGANGGNDYGADGGTDNGANGGNDYGADGGTDNGANGGNDYGADGGTDNGADGGNDYGADGGTDNGADGGNDYGADGGTDNGADGGNDYDADGGTDNGANGGNDYGADGGTDNGADGGNDYGADGGTDNGANGGNDDGGGDTPGNTDDYPDPNNGGGETTPNYGNGDGGVTKKKRRRKRYAELLDGFNFTAFDPTFDEWFRKRNSIDSSSTDEYRAKIDTATKLDALFKKTFMSLARWERSRLGHNITKMLLKCSFAGRQCEDNKKLFRLHQTAEYGNCWTLSSPKFLSQDAGPNGDNESRRYMNCDYFINCMYLYADAGLSVVLNLQSTDYLEGITQGYGARIQIHNRGTYPDPFQDGISLPASMETSIGLKLISFTRLSGHFGDCEDGEEFKQKYKRPYTRRTCQIFCHAGLIMDRCGCFDETSEEVAVKTNQAKNMSACNNEQEYDCVNNIRKALERKEIKCACRNPCKESTYIKSITSHQWPTDEHAKLLLAGICAVDTEACKSFLNTNNTVSRVANNFLKLNIYFEDLNYEEIVEEPDIGLAQILSDVGGAIGLWIGLSVISFCEIVQLIVELINMTRHKIMRPRQERQATKKRRHDSTRELKSIKHDNGTGNGNQTGSAFAFSNQAFHDPYSTYVPFNNPPVYRRQSSRDTPFTGFAQQSKRLRY